MHQTLQALTAFAYLAATTLLYVSIRHGDARLKRLSVALATIAVLLHMLEQLDAWLPLPVANVTILSVFSLCSLAAALLLLGTTVSRKSLYDAGLIALPVAALAILADWFVPVPATTLSAQEPAVAVHVFSSIAAFGVFSVASIYAVFASLIDHFLRRHHLNRLVRTLPALDVLEGLLFQLILAGQALLTVSLITGLVFVNDLFAQHLVHKTVLSILAWLVFGALLWGRHFRGWRGRVAVRLTL
ncbi:MAG: cytochrome c biogenesis protein CcsA, partial [Xanthomonadales bacterium]|nr:cytochrome c biogenesis protein CcsA [Xanthomonadales bacterium]